MVVPHFCQKKKKKKDSEISSHLEYYKDININVDKGFNLLCRENAYGFATELINAIHVLSETSYLDV